MISIGIIACRLAVAGFVAAAVTLPGVVRAQVAVGYNSTTSATGARAMQQTLNLRNRSSFGIGGSNVEPIDGGNIYDPTTLWRIRDSSKASSLVLVQENSVFDTQKDKSNSSIQGAARQEQISVTLVPPLSTVLEPQTVNPFAPVLPVLPSPLSTSVFP